MIDDGPGRVFESEINNWGVGEMTNPLAPSHDLSTIDNVFLKVY